MPKKTKREKLRADQNRSSRTVIPLVTTQTQLPQQENSPSAFSFRTIHQPDHPPTASSSLSVDVVEFSAIKRDIMKTVFLAAIAIAVEVVLYWKVGK